MKSAPIYKGEIEGVKGGNLFGWVSRQGAQGAELFFVLDDGIPVAILQQWPDEDGAYGDSEQRGHFSIALPFHVKDGNRHVMSLRRVGDNVSLPDSERTIRWNPERQRSRFSRRTSCFNGNGVTLSASSNADKGLVLELLRQGEQPREALALQVSIDDIPLGTAGSPWTSCSRSVRVTLPSARASNPG
ncbi:MAG: hypothetical protein R3E84_10175 [Pseudomonadales bacterium]